MLQSFLPEIYDGDFRILIIHGEVCPIALARIPQEGSFKGNLAAGGKGIAKEISTQQKNVAKEIGKILIKNNIAFAGIDMIGNHLLRSMLQVLQAPKRFLINQELIQLNCYLKNFYDKNA